jgi:hypothetical protein
LAKGVAEVALKLRCHGDHLAPVQRTPMGVRRPMIYNVSKNSKLKNRRLKTIVADLTLEAAMLKELAQGLLLTPDRRRSALEAGPPAVRRSFETRAHKVTGQPRSTQRQVAKPRVTVDAEITEI